MWLTCLTVIDASGQKCRVHAQTGLLPAVNSQHGFDVKGHVPTINEAEESRDTFTQFSPHWRIVPGNFAPSTAPSTNPSIRTGVRGLLDLCESSSMPRPPVDGMPANSLIEVVGMAQSSKGVRRLVKSVVYGLKACQVSDSSSYTPCPAMQMLRS